MNNSLSTLARYAVVPALVALAFLCPSLTHAAGTLTANQSVANIQGINDQTDAISTTTANVVGVDATRTLTVNSLPLLGQTTTIGSCVVSYSISADSLNCTGNTANISTTTHATASAVATALRALTNVSDNVNGHGALTIGGSGSTASFTTTGVEASSTVINFVDGTSGAVSSTASTAGTVPVVEVLAVTFGGTVDTGDLFNIGLPTVETAAYTTQSTDTTLANIATGMNADIHSAGDYSSMVFTTAAAGNAVVFTAKTAGTAFNLTTLTVNTTPVAQVVTFTPSAASGPENYLVTINGTTYTYVDTSGLLSNISAGIASMLSSVPAVTCVQSGNSITCTAKTAGTAFTYGASTSAGSSSGGSGGGGGGGYIAITPGTTTGTIVPTTPSSPTAPLSYPTGTASLIKTNLKTGSRGDSVKALQTLLMSDTTLGFKGPISGYFGPLTLAGVEAFQVKYKIVGVGGPGYGNVGPKTRAALITAFGS